MSEAGLYDAVVIGAGPAGLAAAVQLADHHARVLVLDEQPAPGGQIYRGVESMSTRMPELFELMGADYARGDELVARFRTCGAAYFPASPVWQIVPGAREGAPHEVWFTRDGVSESVIARALILATGAMERAVPVPGWTLPGVMSAGAVQILLKTAGVVPEGMVLAGSGPLIYLLAAQILATGARLMALLDTTAKGNMWNALPALPRALTGAGPGYLWKGVSLKAALKREGVPVFKNVTGIVLHGTSEVTDVEFTSRGRPLWLSAGVVALHEGVIPSQQMTRSLGLAHEWDAAQQCFRPTLDAFGRTSVPTILVAGDGGGISGARAAEHTGRIAASAVLHHVGAVDEAGLERMVAPERRGLAGQVSVRPFLDRLFAPPAWITTPADEVIVCRCEEITAGQVREAARIGAQGPNQAKAFLRTGMGACQGRVCGPLVSALMAQAHGTSAEKIGYYRVRPPLKPITIGELAAIPRRPGDPEGVVTSMPAIAGGTAKRG